MRLRLRVAAALPAIARGGVSQLRPDVVVGHTGATGKRFMKFSPLQETREIRGLESDRSLLGSGQVKVVTSMYIIAVFLAG
jgi:hypothetical protein